MGDFHRERCKTDTAQDYVTYQMRYKGCNKMEKLI